MASRAPRAGKALTAGGAAPQPSAIASGSGFDLQHGVRTMKVYPITEADMLSLKLTTGLSSLLLSVGTALIGYSIDIFIGASFADARANALNPVVKYVGPIAFAAGVLFVLCGGVAA